MTIYRLLAVLLFAIGSWCCSISPGAPQYSITDRTILAPIVIHGRVLNISTTTRRNVQYKACVQVLEVIKGDSSLPKLICFGDFGGDYLCLTDVFEQNEYIFFMNKDRTARYKDGIPVSAVLANSRVLDLAKQGYCNPYRTQSKLCERPSINRLAFNAAVRVKEGQNALLTCLGIGSRPIFVTWRKRGDENISGVTTFHAIKSVTMSDMGVYECTVRNAAGTTSEFVRLYVEPVPCGVHLNLGPGQQSVIESPNHPRAYPMDKMCSWRICPLQGQRVKLDFNYFDLSRSVGDNLQIRQECLPVRSGVIKHGMLSNPGTLVSKCTSRCVQVWFQSTNGYGENNPAKGFQATVSSTNEGAMLFDYKRLYCETKILLKLVTKEAYFSRMSGRVLHNYKNNAPLPGQEIAIRIVSSITDLFGVFTEISQNIEYYVGADVSSSGTYTLKFVLKTDARNKPEYFDSHISKFKTELQDCSATPRPPGKKSLPVPTDPPRPPATPAPPAPPTQRKPT